MRVLDTTPPLERNLVKSSVRDVSVICTPTIPDGDEENCGGETPHDLPVYFSVACDPCSECLDRIVCNHTVGGEEKPRPHPNRNISHTFLHRFKRIMASSARDCVIIHNFFNLFWCHMINHIVNIFVSNAVGYRYKQSYPDQSSSC